MQLPNAAVGRGLAPAAVIKFVLPARSAFFSMNGEKRALHQPRAGTNGFVPCLGMMKQAHPRRRSGRCQLCCFIYFIKIPSFDTNMSWDGVILPVNLVERVGSRGIQSPVQG